MQVMLPKAVGWTVFLIWICAHAAGWVAVQLGLPALLGMLLVGVLLRNVPGGELLIWTTYAHQANRCHILVGWHILDSVCTPQMRCQACRISGRCTFGPAASPPFCCVRV